MEPKTCEDTKEVIQEEQIGKPLALKFHGGRDATRNTRKKLTLNKLYSEGSAISVSEGEMQSFLNKSFEIFSNSRQITSLTHQCIIQITFSF
jgi:hypothetical protein